MANAKKVAAPTKLALWNDLVTRTVRATKNGDKLGLIACIHSAEGNATDTMQDEHQGGAWMTSPEHEELFASLAYGSLSLTPKFNDNGLVRAFFSGIGYRW